MENNTEYLQRIHVPISVFFKIKHIDNNNTMKYNKYIIVKYNKIVITRLKAKKVNDLL